MITASEAYDIMEKAIYTEEKLLDYFSNSIIEAARKGEDRCSIDIETLQPYFDQGFDLLRMKSLLFTHGYQSHEQCDWFVISWKNAK